jgi:hypothetical protein
MFAEYSAAIPRTETEQYMESVAQPAPSGCHEFAAIRPRLTEITNHMHLAAPMEQRSAPVATETRLNKPATTLAALFAKLNLAVQPRPAADVDAVTAFWSVLNDQNLQPQAQPQSQPKPQIQPDSLTRLESELKTEPEIEAQPLAPSSFDADGDFATREIFRRDADDLGLESLEIASAGTRSTFDPALRTDGLLFRVETVSPGAAATLEVFSGRSDGMVQQETVDGEDGSLILERKYDASVSANGLISESFFKCGNSQSISRMFDSTRNEYGLRFEKATLSSLGMRTEYGYQQRRDRLVSTISLRSLDSVTTSEFVYCDGRVEHR